MTLTLPMVYRAQVLAEIEEREDAAYQRGYDAGVSATLATAGALLERGAAARAELLAAVVDVKAAAARASAPKTRVIRRDAKGLIVRIEETSP